MSMTKGHFKLTNLIQPRLAPGEYTLTITHDVKDGDSTLIHSTHEQTLQVEGVGLRLQPNDIVGMFPPPQNQQANKDDLAHIALRRRTLPWAHGLGGSELVLLVFEDNEVQLSDGVARDLFTPSQLLSSFPSASPDAPCTIARVRKKTLQRILPLPEEQDLLAHVREVSVEDPEGRKDDDGFISIVIANRLPQKPGSHYTACLVALHPWIARGDGAWPTREAPWANAKANQLWPTPDEADTSDGDEAPIAVSSVTSFLPMFGAYLPASSQPMGVDLSSVELPATASSGLFAAGGLTNQPLANLAVEWMQQHPGALVASTATLSQGVIGAQGVLVVDEATLEVLFGPEIALPVLAYWTFSTAKASLDFQTRMTDMTQTTGAIGMLAGSAVTPYGHIALPHPSRGGESGTSLYAGPLRPVPLNRTHQPALHSEQLIQTLCVDDKPQDDMSYAAAFELGRLLTLGDRELLGILAKARTYVSSRRTSHRAVSIVSQFLGVPLDPEVQILAHLDMNDLTAPILPTDPRIDPTPPCMDAEGGWNTLAADPGGLEGWMNQAEVAPGLDTKTLHDQGLQLDGLVGADGMQVFTPTAGSSPGDIAVTEHLDPTLTGRPVGTAGARPVEGLTVSDLQNTTGVAVDMLDMHMRALMDTVDNGRNR